MIAVLYARMFAMHGFDPTRMQLAQVQPVPRMHPVQMQAAQMQAAQMQAAQMQAAQMQSARMRPAQIQSVHMHRQPTQMQVTRMPTAQMQVTRMPPAQMQAGQLYALNNAPSSQSTTNANSSLNPLLPGSNKPTDRDALHGKVKQEIQIGWKFDISEWSKKPDPIQKDLYGFSRPEYTFLKENKLFKPTSFRLQWEIDRREESEKLNALRPWYRKEGTDDSDLVLMSNAVLSQELEAFYGGMEKGKISNVTVPDKTVNDHNNATGVATNLSRTRGKNGLKSFVGKAHVGRVASDLLSKMSMKARSGGRFRDSGVCIDGGRKIPLRKTAKPSKVGGEEIGLHRAGDEDELTSVDHAPCDLEGLTCDRYHDTACDLQLGPWQASIGELTKKFQPETPDPSLAEPSAISLLELTHLATGKSSNGPSIDLGVGESSITSQATSVKWMVSPLNSASSSDSSLPSSPETPTPRGSRLWDKGWAKAGSAPHIGRQYQVKCKHHPGDARYALLEQAGYGQSTRLAYLTLFNRYRNRRNRKALHRRRAMINEDVDNDDMIKVEDAETGFSSHIPTLQNRPKKFGKMKTCHV